MVGGSEERQGALEATDSQCGAGLGRDCAGQLPCELWRKKKKKNNYLSKHLKQAMKALQWWV